MIHDENELDLEKEQVKAVYQKKVSAKQRLLRCLECELEKCLGWELVEKEGILLQANLYRVSKGQKTIEVEDFEDGSKRVLELEGSSKEEALSKVFKKAKKLKRGIDPLKRKIEVGKQEIEKLEEQLRVIDQALSIKELRPFKKETVLKKDVVTKEEKKKLPYKEYLSSSGYRILVGKSKKDNDALTFKVGTAHDVWMHTSDFPGSHVIIKAKKNVEVDAATIEEAAFLAIDASQAKDKSMADVVITRQKHLKRVKGKPGQVMVGEKKVRRVVVDKGRLLEILERKVR